MTWRHRGPGRPNVGGLREFFFGLPENMVVCFFDVYCWQSIDWSLGKWLILRQKSKNKQIHASMPLKILFEARLITDYTRLPGAKSAWFPTLIHWTATAVLVAVQVQVVGSAVMAFRQICIVLPKA